MKMSLDTIMKYFKILLNNSNIATGSTDTDSSRLSGGSSSMKKTKAKYNIKIIIIINH